MHMIATLLPAADMALVGPSGKSGFHGKVSADGDMLGNGVHHQPHGLGRHALGIEGGQTTGDEIRIDERRTSPLVCQELIGEGGFASAIGAGQNDSARSHAADRSEAIGLSQSQRTRSTASGTPGPDRDAKPRLK